MLINISSFRFSSYEPVWFLVNGINKGIAMTMILIKDARRVWWNTCCFLSIWRYMIFFLFFLFFFLTLFMQLYRGANGIEENLLLLLTFGF